MPVVQIDWTSIKALFGDVTEFIALTSRQRALLLSLTEQLTWRKTFDDFGYDWADKDTLDLEIADLERNLTMPVVLSDLIGYIDEIEDLLRALNNTANCCGPVDVTDGDQYTDPVIDGSGNVPQNIIDAGYATGTSDWAGFYDYKCMISHVLIDDLEQGLRDIAAQFDTTGVIFGGIVTVAAIIATIVAAVATGGVSLIVQILGSVGAAGTVWTGLSKLGALGTETLADNVAANHEDLACAVYNADGTYDAIDDLWAVIDDLFTDSEALILKNMNLGPKLKGLYAGRYDQQDIAQNMADNGLDPADYDCTCVEEPEAPEGYHLEHPTYGGFTAYLNVASHNETYDAETGLLTFDVTAGGGGNLHFRHYFENIGGLAPFYHAFIFELVSFTSACDFGQVYNGRLDCKADESTIGARFAGYNTNLHSGSTWDDWTALFDYVGNHSENGFNDVRQTNIVNNCAGYGATHYWAVRVWAVVAD